jgi:hypothetical protein
MSIASGFRILRSWAEPFSRDLADSQNKLTFGRRVFSDRTLIPLSQAVGSGGLSPLFASAFQAKQSIGSPTRIDRG